jgi:hypothetical protein
MKKFGLLILGIVVLCGIFMAIAWLSGVVSNPNIMIVPERVPSLLTFFVFMAFISGITIGIFIQANAEEWLIEIKRKQKEQLEKLSQ